ncbi:MAG: glycosyltransferase family 4 protein, partial [Chloroflexi bacterium]|nr:glycosyltransferase family 4 protein [Chloroflexota bacterium]
MHQYTADLANRMARWDYEVHLVTGVRYPADRYLPNIRVHTPVETRDTGFSLDALQPRALSKIAATLDDIRPDVVHITGPHIWNTAVIRQLRRRGVPVIHSLHDLDPHPGSAYGSLLHLWNRAIARSADHILVHATRYRERVLGLGVPLERVSSLPLLHLFLGQRWLEQVPQLAADVRYEPLVLFFGRLERYKGVGELLSAWSLLGTRAARLVLAGPGEWEQLWPDPLPPGVEVRNRLIDDDEALDLFRRCALLVLPYIGATQSALIPAAYYFHKPVIATRSGALAEYVQEGVSGWLVKPSDPRELAACLADALADPERLPRMGAAGRA